jgi:hypothetical protein
MGGELLAVKGEAFPGNAVEYELSPFFRRSCQLAVNLDVETVTVETPGTAYTASTAFGPLSGPLVL